MASRSTQHRLMALAVALVAMMPRIRSGTLVPAARAERCPMHPGARAERSRRGCTGDLGRGLFHGHPRRTSPTRTCGSGPCGPRTGCRPGHSRCPASRARRPACTSSGSRRHRACIPTTTAGDAARADSDPASDDPGVVSEPAAAARAIPAGGLASRSRWPGAVLTVRPELPVLHHPDARPAAQRATRSRTTRRHRRARSPAASTSAATWVPAWTTIAGTSPRRMRPGRGDSRRGPRFGRLSRCRSCRPPVSRWRRAAGRRRHGAHL